MKKVVLSILCCLMILPLHGVTVLEDNVWYNVDDVFGSISVIKNQNGTQANYANGYITIKSTLTKFPGKNVTSISESAFYGCVKLTRISIPSTINSIGESAFWGCTSLYSANIPSGIKKIKKYTFASCPSLESIEIPSSVTEIEEGAFANSGLTSIEIPNSVTKIGSSAFYNCNLTSVEIPSAVTVIENSTFYNCNLTSIEIPNSVTSIGDFAFASNKNLRTIVLPESLKSIGKNAFVDGSQIEDVYCYALDPPQAVEEDGYVGIFEDVVYNGRATLHVPAESLQKYKTTLPWSRFYNIKAYDEIVADEIIITPPTAAITIGETLSLTATVLPENTTDTTVTWKSDNEAIATVGADGMVTAVSVGTANITATCGEVTATCKITVNPVLAGSITLNVQDMTLLAGQAGQISATVEPENVTDPTIVWKSDSEAIAIVSADGTVTAVSVGVAYITATCGDASATCKVNVKGSDIITVTPGEGDDEWVDGSNVKVRVNHSVTVNLSLSENLSIDPQFTWTLADGGSTYVKLTPSDDTLSATFTGLSVGETSYTVSLAGNELVSGKVIVIAEVPMATLRLDPSELSMAQNAAPVKLSTVYTPDNATMPEFAWTSSDTSVAAVDADGTVTPVGQGSATVTATATDGSGLSADCAVTVTAPVDDEFELTFDDASIGVDGITILLGETFTLTPKAKEGYVLPENITWSSSADQIAPVDESGTVTGIAVGTATITASATFNGKTVSASCKVTVKGSDIITVTPGEGDDEWVDGSNVKVRVNHSVTVNLSLSENLSIDPQFTWTLADGGSTYVKLTPSDDTLSATFTGLSVGETSYAVSLAGNELVSGKVTVTDESDSVTLVWQDETLSADATIAVYTPVGQLIRMLAVPAGTKMSDAVGRHIFAPGTYIVRITAGDATFTRKAVIR